MLDVIALILTVIGGINWGLIGIFQFDLVAWLCGGQAAVVSRIIYTLVGLSASSTHSSASPPYGAFPSCSGTMTSLKSKCTAKSRDTSF